MARPERPGSERRVVAFVEPRFIEPERERLHVAAPLPGERGDGGGVETAREEDADRPVAQEHRTDRPRQMATQRGRGLVQRQ